MIQGAILRALFSSYCALLRGIHLEFFRVKSRLAGKAPFH